MESEFHNRAIQALQVFADGKARDVRPGTHMDVECIKWLFDNGHLQGIDTTDKDDLNAGRAGSYMSLAITCSGHDLLEKPRKEQEAKDSREAIYERKHPMQAKVTVGVAVTLLSTAVLALFSCVGCHGL